VTPCSVSEGGGRSAKQAVLAAVTDLRECWPAQEGKARLRCGNLSRRVKQREVPYSHMRWWDGDAAAELPPSQQRAELAVRTHSVTSAFVGRVAPPSKAAARAILGVNLEGRPRGSQAQTGLFGE